MKIEIRLNDELVCMAQGDPQWILKCLEQATKKIADDVFMKAFAKREESEVKNNGKSEIRRSRERQEYKHQHG